MGKKNPYVFTIGFDKKNPEHLEVVEILNGTEKKAALIAEAILQYTGKKSGGDTGVSQENIQAMVRLLVRQEMQRLTAQTPASLPRLLLQTLELQPASRGNRRQISSLQRP